MGFFDKLFAKPRDFAIVVLLYKQRQTYYVLLTKRPSHFSYPGEWVCPGGKIEKGETFENAAIRELREETRIQINKYDLKKLTPRNTLNNKFTIHPFYAIVFKKAECNFSKQEVEKGDWFSLENIIENKLISINGDVYDLEKEKIGYVTKKAIEECNHVLGQNKINEFENIKQVVSKNQDFISKEEFENKMANLNYKKYNRILKKLTLGKYNYKGDEDDIFYLINVFEKETGDYVIHRNTQELVKIGESAIQYLFRVIESKKFYRPHYCASTLGEIKKKSSYENKINIIKHFIEDCFCGIDDQTRYIITKILEETKKTEKRILINSIKELYKEKKFGEYDVEIILIKWFNYDESKKLQEEILPYKIDTKYFEANKKKWSKNIPISDKENYIYNYIVVKYREMSVLFDYVKIEDKQTISLYLKYLDNHDPKNTTSFQSALYLFCILCSNSIILPDKTDKLLQLLFNEKNPLEWIKNDVIPICKQALIQNNILVARKMNWTQILINSLVGINFAKYSLNENLSKYEENINYILNKIKDYNEGNFLLNLCFAYLLRKLDIKIIDKIINFVKQRINFIELDSYDNGWIESPIIHGCIFAFPSEIGHLFHYAVEEKENKIGLLRETRNIKESEIMDRLFSSIDKTTGELLGTDSGLEYIYWTYQYGLLLKDELNDNDLKKILKEFKGDKSDLSKAEIVYIGAIRKKRQLTEENEDLNKIRYKINLIKDYMSNNDVDAVAGILSLNSNSRLHKNIAILPRTSLENNAQEHKFAERIAIEFTISLALSFYKTDYGVGVLSYVQHRAVEYLLKNVIMKNTRDYENVFKKIDEIGPEQIKTWVEDGIRQGKITKQNITRKKIHFEDIEKIQGIGIKTPEEYIEQYEKQAQFSDGFGNIDDVKNANLEDPVIVQELMITATHSKDTRVKREAEKQLQKLCTTKQGKQRFNEILKETQNENPKLTDAIKKGYNLIKKTEKDIERYLIQK
ncbi:MAG: hypothetical protein B6U87_01970 [Candidatus Aenigmarchaeota archaeon ex4484_52]|nr:MAG: hypothetical protein B6U87_01970 [Candidatus Aenigmarchaeota archaeon ex4484_52]